MKVSGFVLSLIVISCIGAAACVTEEKSEREDAVLPYASADSSAGQPLGASRVILDSSQAMEVNRLPDCTRPAPVVEGGWQMSAEDARQADSAVLGLEVPCMFYGNDGKNSLVSLDPAQYFRQYVGVIYRGKRMVYINATRGKGPNPASQFHMICDGGAFQWGGLWDPAQKRFSNIACNAQG